MEHANECQMLDGNDTSPTFCDMSPGVPTVTHVEVTEFTDQWFVECFSVIFLLHYQISQILSPCLLNMVKWGIAILLEILLR